VLRLFAAYTAHYVRAQLAVKSNLLNLAARNPCVAGLWRIIVYFLVAGIASIGLSKQMPLVLSNCLKD
jgi:hypothetical protein